MNSVADLETPALTIDTSIMEPDQADRRLEKVPRAGTPHVILKPPLRSDRAEAIRLLGKRAILHYRGRLV